MSLSKIAFGTAFLSMANTFRVASQFVVLPIMAHLLGPTEFGLVAIVMPFVIFSMLISDGGIGASLVRTGDKDQDIWSTAFWLIAGLGTCLAAILMGIAPLVARLYGDDRLQPIMAALAVVVLLQALVAVPGASLQKHARFLALGVSETAAVASGLLTMLAIAFQGGGAWALVGQQLAFWMVRLTLTATVSPFRPRLIFDIRRTWPHVVFGRDTIASTVVGFFSRNLDALVIGKVLGAGQTGLYSVAMQLARLPLSIVSAPLHVVMYSHISQQRDDRGMVRATFLATTRLVSIFVIPAMGLLAAAHHPIFSLMLSEKWADAAPVFMLLAPVGAIQAISGIGASVLVAYGKTLTQLRLNAEFAILWLSILAVSVAFGVQWVAGSFCLATVLFFPRTAWVTLSIIQCPARDYAVAIATPLLVTLVATSAAVVSFSGPIQGNLAQIAIAAALGLIAVSASCLLQRGRIKAELRLLRQGAPAGRMASQARARGHQTPRLNLGQTASPASPAAGIS